MQAVSVRECVWRELEQFCVEFDHSHRYFFRGTVFCSVVSIGRKCIGLSFSGATFWILGQIICVYLLFIDPICPNRRRTLSDSTACRCGFWLGCAAVSAHYRSEHRGFLCCWRYMEWDFTTSTFWLVFVYGLFVNLQNFGIDQNFVQRYITAKTEKEAKKAAVLGSLLYIVPTGDRQPKNPISSRHRRCDCGRLRHRVGQPFQNHLHLRDTAIPLSRQYGDRFRHTGDFLHRFFDQFLSQVSKDGTIN